MSRNNRSPLSITQSLSSSSLLIVAPLSYIFCIPSPNNKNFESLSMDLDIRLFDMSYTINPLRSISDVLDFSRSDHRSYCSIATSTTTRVYKIQTNSCLVTSILHPL